MTHDSSTPSEWFVRHAALVTAGSQLLDVACGHGRHAKYFAERGANVTAVDRDQLALSTLQSVSNLTTHCADLESAPWPYAPHSFDVVLVCNYLWRPTFGALLATIKPGGLLLYETFMDGNEQFGKPSRPDFLLRSNELLQHTRDAFQIIAFEEGTDAEPLAVKQRICARKRATL
jgi:SAM-dependent methyltransferase